MNEKHISFSQYSTFKDCPWKWKLLYKDKIKEFSPGIDAILGTALHETLQHYLGVLYNKTEAEAHQIDLTNFLYKSLTKEILKIEKEQKISPKEYINKEVLYEYYEDGVEILKFFSKKRKDYFIKRGFKLLGCEIKLSPEIRPGIKFVGYIDVVIQNESTGEVFLYDFKKSYRGWKAKTKANPTKRAQLQLYKWFYSKEFNIDLSKIQIEFVILKQKIFEGGDWPEKRIQIVKPPASERTIKKTYQNFMDFINFCYTEDGDYNESAIYKKKPFTSACKYCPFTNKSEYCDKNGKSK